MRNKTIKVKLYPFNELDPEVQEKVIAGYGDINVDYDWWLTDDYYNEIAKEYGLDIRMDEVCFDLDRGSCVYFETYNHGSKDNYEKGIAIESYKKFCKKAGLKWKKRYAEAFSIDHIHYAGSGENIIEADSYLEGSYITDEERDTLQETLGEFCDKILEALRNNYDHLTSEEAIRDTIEANDFEFLKDGSQKIFV